MTSAHRFFRSSIVGTVSAAVLGGVSFAVGGGTHIVTAYLAPGIPIAGLLSPLLPSRTAYWIDPEGGPIAFLMLTLACAALFWSVLIGSVYHYLRRAA
jgi:MFS superfamily sulfate permease-like transporter